MRRLGAATCIFMAACSASGDGDDDAEGQSRRDRYTPAFEDAPCPAELASAAGAACGFLVVPEDRSEPGGADVHVFAARLPAVADSSQPPAVVLQGGPGDATDLGSFVDHPLRDEREVILVDQRGVGLSEPSLACPEIAEFERALIGRDIDDDAVIDDARTATQACRDRLTATGVDVAAYDSAAAAADVADLRIALGVDEWYLVGSSYGSRLALTVARDDDTGIAGLALSGPYPPNAQFGTDLAANAERAFQVLFDACAADPACTATTPDLEATFEAFYARFDAAPVDIETADSSGRSGTVRFDGDLVALLLQQALYETELIPALPGLVTAAAGGESLDLIAAAALDRIDDSAAFSNGLFLSVSCQDERPFGDTRAVTDVEASRDYLAAFSRHREIEGVQCETWDVGESSAIENEPVRSDLPALILVGEYDPVTPPGFGELAAETLSQVTLIEVPGTGHDVTAQPCPRRVRNDFLADPSGTPDDPCLAELGPPSFST